MQKIRTRWLSIVGLMIATLVIFSVCRLAFWLQNLHYFGGASARDLVASFVYGIRFDLCAAAYALSLVFVLALLPVRFRGQKWYFRVVKWLFVFVNFGILVVEFTDAGMFAFMFRRLTVGDWILIINTVNTFPSLFAEHWYLILLLIGLIYGLAKCFDKLMLSVWELWLGWWRELAMFFCSLLVLVLVMRGGWQTRPLSPSAAALFVTEQRVSPLVGNTLLNLIFSSQLVALQPLNYFSETALEAKFPIFFEHSRTNPTATKCNIVIIALESFGCEYLNTYNPDAKGVTPFLDSLLARSFHADISYANGLRSNQGIAAILTGIPQLMDQPWQYSSYQNSQVDGLATLLKRDGYETGFCHLSIPGSMEFDRLSAICGFDHFYDMTAHPLQSSLYDGQWGIWDDDALQFFANTISKYRQPFMGFAFTITSHHPYKVPDSYEKKYPNLDPLFRATQYTDDALRHFFETASQQTWYQNTVFVLTADHIGRAFSPDFQAKEQRYRIPICFFRPDGKLTQTPPKIAQQLDIVPTVLGQIGYNRPYMTFGRDLLDSTTSNRGFNYTFSENNYQISDTAWTLTFDGERVTGLYRQLSDKLLQHNLCGKNLAAEARLIQQIKMVRQQHNHAFLKNRLVRR